MPPWTTWAFKIPDFFIAILERMLQLSIADSYMTVSIWSASNNTVNSGNVHCGRRASAEAGLSEWSGGHSS